MNGYEYKRVLQTPKTVNNSAFPSNLVNTPSITATH